MRKWTWSLSVALLVWAVGLKFSPEETVLGSLSQLRFEAVSLLAGAFIGLMFGLVATRSKTASDEKRKLLYSALGCCSTGALLTWGPSVKRVLLGALVGAIVGVIVAGMNYLVVVRARGRQRLVP